MKSIVKNKNQLKNISVGEEDLSTMTKHGTEETTIIGLVQPLAVAYSTVIQKRCKVNPILKELHKLFPEIMYPPFNGFFFGNRKIRNNM